MPAAVESHPERSFSVHARDEAPSRGRHVEAQNFVEAAVAYLEAYGPDGEPGGDIALMVEDCETGERQCFRIDLASGEAEPCD